MNPVNIIVDYAIAPELPPAHTAIAEWLACILCILPLRKRLHGAARYAVLALMLPPLLLANRLRVATIYWTPMMLLGLGIMLLGIWLCCRISFFDAGYYWARAFIAAEFAASLEWVIYYYIMVAQSRIDKPLSYACMGATYLVVFGLLYLIQRRRQTANSSYGAAPRDFWSAVVIAFAVFAVSNLNYILKNSSYSQSLGAGTLMTRTLVDFAGVILLFVQQEQRRETMLQRELTAMENLFQRQYDQYQQYKANDEILGRKYHDLKHQIAAIRSESDPEKRESYLSELDEVIEVYESRHKTGNSILDTVLSGKGMLCAQKGIEFLSYADAAKLSIMDKMDICSVFGNALDNAIESVQTIADPEKRQIRLYVYSQNQFLIIRVENYYEGHLKYEDGGLKTTKKRAEFHGYGLKSIIDTAEKYGGNATITTENNLFQLILLIPCAD